MSSARVSQPFAIVASLLAALAIVVAVVAWNLDEVTSSVRVLVLLGLVILAAVLALGVLAERRSDERHAERHAELRALAAAVGSDAASIADVQQRVRRLQEGLNNSSASGPLRYINKHADQVFEQVQATINLFAMVDIAAPVPPLRHWAVSPDALNLLVQELLAVRPRVVVECGSGSSTLFLALVARKHGLDTRIVALDHEQEYADKTNRLLAAHGVDDIASARLAPLEDVTTDRGAQPWYAATALDDLSDVGLLFVDGPPGGGNRLARYPALPLLWDRLAPGASIVLDDTDRADEQEIIALWAAAHPELSGESIATEKGAYILRRP
ncbi:class I SAM-dependent methyltransferase [Aeromicrobium stalagmiti]|uniref:class I SAM-dependent methyltransferase n=1 Tax=Aeromicrobium stalagmiti TaxID=2738988 RepID=UPI001568A0A4|nr:class I SAM-dependent methyltransferase [Aeromicrobium stalagmiti]NRQ49529.1 class I SAM-dependent methyltransferase [Aeromicrobium stalagmiti]